MRWGVKTIAWKSVGALSWLLASPHGCSAYGLCDELLHSMVCRTSRPFRSCVSSMKHQMRLSDSTSFSKPARICPPKDYIDCGTLVKGKRHSRAVCSHFPSFLESGRIQWTASFAFARLLFAPGQTKLAYGCSNQVTRCKS